MIPLVFLGLFGCYASLSPGEIAGVGYTAEEIRSGNRILAIAGAVLKDRAVPPMEWSRHGPLPVLFDLPFLMLGSAVHSQDRVLSMQPVLFTALLATVLFVWLRRLTSPGMSFLITLAGAFGTMLWPYAYIGLETKQSLFLLLAGYLGLAGGGIRGWARILLFSVCCGLAVSLKSTGVALFPAIAYLVYVQFRPEKRVPPWPMVAAALVIGVIWAGAAVGRQPFWDAFGGSFAALRPWLIDHPLYYFANLLGIFGSPTKGLFFFAPVLVLSLYAVPQICRTHRDTGIFVLLAVSGMAAELAILRGFADELWGPRYMHSAVAPLLVSIGAARPRFQLRREAPLIALAAVGVWISFLGAFSSYGRLYVAAAQTGQNNLEWLMGDSIWNHARFNARLLEVWRDGGGQVRWTPSHGWMFVAPPGPPRDKSIDLRELASPQSFLLRYWPVVPKQGSHLAMFVAFVSALVAGLTSLLLAGWITAKESQAVAVQGRSGAFVKSRHPP